MDALATAHDASVQMIDTSIVRGISTGPASSGTEDSPWGGYDADWIRALAARKGVLANIPPRC